ncbi:hypothetical protein K469DRAFT_548984, partial [Zopfia rhizophila CBS 207.26]
SFMFFQLKHFNPSASAATIPARSGFIISSKPAAQVCAGLLWGRLADCRHIGRKDILIIGLVVSSLVNIEYRFSEKFKAAIT